MPAQNPDILTVLVAVYRGRLVLDAGITRNPNLVDRHGQGICIAVDLMMLVMIRFTQPQWYLGNLVLGARKYLALSSGEVLVATGYPRS